MLSVVKCEAGAFDEIVEAASTLQEYEARVAPLEREAKEGGEYRTIRAGYRRYGPPPPGGGVRLSRSARWAARLTLEHMSLNVVSYRSNALKSICVWRASGATPASGRRAQAA